MSTPEPVPEEVLLYERPDGTPTTQAEGNTPLPTRAEREAMFRTEVANIYEQKELIMSRHSDSWSVGGFYKTMTRSIPSNWRALRGNTYRIKDELLALGARWDRDTSLWWISPENLREAQNLIDETGGRRP